MAGQRRLIFVLGVHRSGTSLAASVLAGLGAWPGGMAMDGSGENPEGFWEHPAIRLFDDSFLRQIGGSWDNWAFTARDVAAALPGLPAWSDEAVALLCGHFPGDAPVLIKDPRLMLLLPLWLPAAARAGFAPEVVLVLRDPAEVAASQTARTPGDPRFYALLPDAQAMSALWVMNMVSALETLPESGAHLVLHRDLLADPVPALQALRTALDLPGDPAQVAADRVKPALHRQRAALAAPAPGFPTLAADLFAALTGPGGNRRLTRAEAQSALPDLATLHPLLPAIRASLSGARRALDQPR